MASFSASDVAVTGFRIVRERPRAVAIWAAILVVINLGLTLGMVSWMGPALASLSAMNAAPSRDPAQAMALVGQLIPFYLALLAYSLVFLPILYATMNRAVLRPAEEGFAYIRLGTDELRQLGLLLLMLGLVILAYIALIIAAVVIMVPVSLAVGRGGGGSAIAALVVILIMIAAVVAWVYAWVRLSLASPMTFATGRINLFGSWRMTRGLFWPLFGAYAVALILGMIVNLLTVVISGAIGAVIGGGGASGIGAMFNPDMSSLGAYMTPAHIVNLMIGAAASALVLPVLFTPSAAIYRDLARGDNASETAATFN